MCGFAGFLGYFVNAKHEQKDAKEVMANTAKNATAGAILGSVVFLLLDSMTELPLGANCGIAIAVSFFGEERSLALIERVVSMRFGKRKDG